MRSIDRNNLTLLEWIAVIGCAGTAVLACETFHVPQKWENATVYTVIVFAAAIVALRPAWHRVGFWQNLIYVLVFHVIALAGIEQSLPPSSQGPHGLPFTAAGIVEALLIAGLLWKKVMRPNANSS